MKKKRSSDFTHTFCLVFRQTVAIVGIFAVSMLGCDASQPDADDLDLATSEAPLYLYTPSLWSRGEKIEVCWTSAGFDTEKAAVRDAITRSWQAYLNVTFTGWGTCPSGGADLEITPGSSMVTSMRNADGAEMELDFTASPETRWTRCIVNNLNRDQCIRVVSIHEFGHALGFAHEHNRPDTPASCTANVQGTCSTPVPGCVTVGDWDGLSIMNYCGGAAALSRGDIYGSIVTYGMDPALVMAMI